MTLLPDTRSRLWAMLGNTPRLLGLVWEAAPRWVVANAIATLGDAIVPVARLYIMKLIVDRVLLMLSQERTSLVPLLGLVSLGFGLTVLRQIFQQTNTYVSRILNDEFALHANGKLLKQAIRLDLAHYESPKFYDTLNRAQKDGSQYPLRALQNINHLLGQTTKLFGLMMLLLRFNPIVLLLLLVTSLPGFWIGVRYSQRRFWMTRRQTPSRRLSEYLKQILIGQSYVKEVRQFSLGSYLWQQWHDIRTEFNRESHLLAKQQSLARLAISSLANLGFYGAYVLVLWQALQGAITIGDLTLYAGAFQQAQGTIRGLLQNIANLYEDNLYVSQYFEFLALEPKIVSDPIAKPFPRPMRKGLVCRNVTFTYPGATEPTLHQIDLTVRPGECVALVGTNGSGKTTLLKLIARFYDLDTGTISIDGIPLPAFDLSDLRQNIGVLFQDFARYALSAADNIGFGYLPERGNRDRLTSAAAAAGADRLLDSLAGGYDTILGKMFAGGVELSGGQWQKIGLARAFMSTAQVLMLDEPTAAVDAIAEHELFQRFRQLTRGKMTFLVSHRFSTVKMADRIVVLERGRITEMGCHDELMALNGTYAGMFRVQAENYQMERSTTTSQPH
ncbi:MAG: ABC transporter ATP-binding protein [Cyanobacteria bacterium J06642_2]